MGRPPSSIDEIDTVFGPKAKDNEEIRGVLNAGHRHGAVAGRCVARGEVVETEELPAFCAVAIAGLGGLPGHPAFPRRRRAGAAPGPRRRGQPFRRRVHAPDGEPSRGRSSTSTLQPLSTPPKSLSISQVASVLSLPSVSWRRSRPSWRGQGGREGSVRSCSELEQTASHWNLQVAVLELQRALALGAAEGARTEQSHASGVGGSWRLSVTR